MNVFRGKKTQQSTPIRRDIDNQHPPTTGGFACGCLISKSFQKTPVGVVVGEYWKNIYVYHRKKNSQKSPLDLPHPSHLSSHLQPFSSEPNRRPASPSPTSGPSPFLGNAARKGEESKEAVVSHRKPLLGKPKKWKPWDRLLQKNAPLSSVH